MPSSALASRLNSPSSPLLAMGAAAAIREDEVVREARWGEYQRLLQRHKDGEPLSEVELTLIKYHPGSCDRCARTGAGRLAVDARSARRLRARAACGGRCWGRAGRRGEARGEAGRRAAWMWSALPLRPAGSTNYQG